MCPLLLAAVAVSDAHADAKGLPRYRHVLHPKTAGFVAAVQALGPRLDAVYDVTVAYTLREGYPDEDARPKERDLLRATLPRAVHLDVSRVPRADLPATSDDAALACWLVQCWARKEQLLATRGEWASGGGARARSGPALQYLVALVGWAAMLGAVGWAAAISPLPVGAGTACGCVAWLVGTRLGGLDELELWLHARHDPPTRSLL